MLENTLYRRLCLGYVDNRNEFAMFKVGDLVKYKAVDLTNLVGVVIKQNPIFKKTWFILWINGLEYQESELYLELVKK